MDYLRDLKEKGELPSFVNIVDMVKCKGKLKIEFKNQCFWKIQGKF